MRVCSYNSKYIFLIFRLCQLCVGKVPGGWCTSTDPYVGFEGAFRCLMEAGEVAFLKHTTVDEMVKSKSFKGILTDEFQLLCKNGQRMPVSDYLQCNWGMVPSNAIVTSSARTPTQRRQYQKFLEAAMKHYSNKKSVDFSSSENNRKSNNKNDPFGRLQDDRFKNQNDQWSNERGISRNNFRVATTTDNPSNDSQLFENFELFESGRYGSRLNLLFQVRYQNQICLITFKLYLLLFF